MFVAILSFTLIGYKASEDDLVLTGTRFVEALKKIPKHWIYNGLLSNDKIKLLNIKTEPASRNGTSTVCAQANHFLDDSGYSTDGYLIVIK